MHKMVNREKEGNMSKLSRHDFLKGAGVAGAMGAFALGGTSLAFADDAADATASAEETTGNPYSQIYGPDANMLPMRQSEFPGPHGPIAFEDREIGEDEIASTEETEVLVIGAGIGGIMASLKAADLGAQVLMLEKMTEGRSSWESFGATQCQFQKGQGIEIDDAQLIDTAGQPIPGLYATGNASGSFYSGNYPHHIPGTSVGRAATFGYVAADHMVNGGQ